MTESVFTIKHPVFEGPLDLLLHLIQKRKLFISDISLAQVADEYIRYIQESPDISISSRAGFISVASTLLLIKSKSLLPTLQLSQDEEEDIKSLEIRLFLYQTVQEVGLSHIQPRFLHTSSYPRIVKPNQDIFFSPDSAITPESLHTHILDVVQTIPEPPKQKPRIYIEKVMSLEEMIGSLTERIQASLKMSFAEFSNNSNTKTDQGKKVHVIVSFLALLELVRQGIVDADQGNRYGNIDIQKSELPPRIGTF